MACKTNAQNQLYFSKTEQYMQKFQMPFDLELVRHIAEEILKKSEFPRDLSFREANAFAYYKTQIALALAIQYLNDDQNLTFHEAFQNICMDPLITIKLSKTMQIIFLKSIDWCFPNPRDLALSKGQGKD